MKKYLLSLFILFISNLTLAQVGIGTTNPDATLHVVGTTVPGSSGGTVDLLNEDFTGYTVSQSHTIDFDCDSDGWEATTTGVGTSNCSNCTGGFMYIDSDATGCIQSATAIMSFTPTQSIVSISFDYRYNNYNNGAGDSFRVYIQNGGAQTDLIPLTTTDADTAYSNTSVTVTAGANYSLRFEYNGNYDYGASIDNVLIQETTTAVAGSYAFRLEDGQQQDGYVMTSDANGYATWKATSGGGGADQTLSISGNDLTISGPGGNTVTIPSSGGGTYTFTNGLNEASGTAKLGGTLIEDTTLNLDDNNLIFSSSTTAVFPGEIIIDGTDRVMMETNFDDEYINFGDGGAGVDGDDGMTFTDSGGDIYTRDFLVGYYNGSFGGSTMATGSIEYLVDGLDELMLEASSFNPLTDNDVRLGGSSKRWTAVWAANGTIQTSDLNLKKNIKTLDYGLDEILRLNPITYKWKKNTIGNTIIPENQQGTKIGFSAQQLQTVIPEVVETHT